MSKKEADTGGQKPGNRLRSTEESIDLIKPKKRYIHTIATRVDDDLYHQLMAYSKQKRAKIFRKALEDYVNKPINDMEMASVAIRKVKNSTDNITELIKYVIELIFFFIRYWFAFKPDIPKEQHKQVFENSKIKQERFVKQFVKEMKGETTGLQKILLMNPQLLTNDKSALSATLRQLADVIEEKEPAHAGS